MNQNDSGKVGNKLAFAAILLAASPFVWSLCKGLAVLIQAVRG